MIATQKQAFHRLFRPLLKIVASEKGITGSVLTDTLTVLWTAQSCPKTKCAKFSFRARLAKRSEVQEMVSWLCELSLLDASFWLSSAYALLASNEYRKNLAMFFTPPSLTGRLLDDLAANGIEFDQHYFLDPACGGAAFLAPIALRIRDTLRGKGKSDLEIIKHVEEHVLGTEIDAALCRLSRHFLSMVLHEEIGRSGYEPDFKVSKANSLADLRSVYGLVDVIVCNPPYRKMTTEETEKYRATFHEVVESQPNLYGLFIALCVNLLRPGGIAALVTPTSFLSGQYFAKLRSFLLTQSDLLSIGMVSDRSGIFMDVEQETALTVLKKAPSKENRKPDTVVSVVSRDGSYMPVGTCQLASSPGAWAIPRAEEDVEILRISSQSPFRLADYGYSVRIGSFVWNRDQRPTYSTAKQAGRRKKQTAVPLLWSSDIQTNGTVRFGTKERGHAEPSWVDYGNLEHPSIVTRPSVLLQRVTSNDQTKRLVAAPVPNELLERYRGFVGENHVVILEQTSEEVALKPKEVAALLMTHTIDRYFRCISGSINVSAFELRQLPLPEPRTLKRLLSQKLSMEQAVKSAIEQYNQTTSPLLPISTLSDHMAALH